MPEADDRPTRRVCVTAPNAGPVIFPDWPEPFGGVETRAWTTAVALAQETSYRPIVHINAPRPLPSRTVDGIEVCASYDRWQPLRDRVVRYFQTPRGQRPFRPGVYWQALQLAMTRPFRSGVAGPLEVEPALAACECDAYLAFGVHTDTYRCLQAARQTQRPFIISLRANDDVPERPLDDSHEQPLPAWRRELYHDAAAFVVQSQWQRDALQERAGRDATVIPNPIDQTIWTPPDDGDNATSRDAVLWVGRADDFHKRPLMAIEVANRLPNVPFLFILNPLDEAIEAEVRRRRPPNVEIVSQVEWADMPATFRRAQAFLSTGAATREGFPNVLLQAASTGTPIVSMHDFDGFIERSGAGLVSGEDIDATTRALQRVVNEPFVDHAAVRQYVTQEHSTETFAQRLATVLDSLFA